MKSLRLPNVLLDMALTRDFEAKLPSEDGVVLNR